MIFRLNKKTWMTLKAHCKIISAEHKRNILPQRNKLKHTQKFTEKKKNLRKSMSASFLLISFLWIMHGANNTMWKFLWSATMGCMCVCVCVLDMHYCQSLSIFMEKTYNGFSFLTKPSTLNLSEAGNNGPLMNSVCAVFGQHSLWTLPCQFQSTD